MSNYNKYKERSPEDTIFEIRRILNDAGLFTIMQWTPEGLKGARSNRITLYPTRNMGQNGKGTDELYATASGLAELMERMQNHWLGQKRNGEDVIKTGGFYDFPDEKYLPVKQIAEQKDPYLSDLFFRLGFVLPTQKEAFLSAFAKEYYHLDDGTIPVVPYVDVFADNIVYLPFAVITLFGLSNGMTAGNTLEEALVQGLSEVYERYIHRILLSGDVTPPEIPREELKKYSTWDLIEQIEASGRYRVSVRDCSLGKGFPVSCVVITDMKKGTFGAKPGCHPSIAVAVERTLTEAFQGRNLENFSSGSTIADISEVRAYHNVLNVTKVGVGLYPAKFLAGDSEWEYRPWTEWESSSNREYLIKLLAHAHAMGLKPLIRDSSHMGFPSYHIVIPGIHEIYPLSEVRFREFRTRLKVADSLCRFPSLTKEEEERMLRLFRFEESSIEHVMGIPYMHDFIGPLYTPDRMAAFLALKHRDYQMAGRLFAKLKAQAEPMEENYLSCLQMYSKLRARGLGQEVVYRQLSALFLPETAEKVKNQTEDPDEMLAKVFEGGARCFDCESCSLKDIHCEYPAASEVRKKIKTAMAKSQVEATELKETLKPIAREALEQEKTC